MLHEALATLWRFVGAANRYVDAQQPWVLAKAAKGGDEDARATLRDVLAELLEACRVIGLAVAPFMPDAAARILAQLGHDYPVCGGRQRWAPPGQTWPHGAPSGDQPGRVETAAPDLPPSGGRTRPEADRLSSAARGRACRPCRG